MGTSLRRYVDIGKVTGIREAIKKCRDDNRVMVMNDVADALMRHPVLGRFNGSKEVFIDLFRRRPVYLLEQNPEIDPVTLTVYRDDRLAGHEDELIIDYSFAAHFTLSEGQPLVNRRIVVNEQPAIAVYGFLKLDPTHDDPRRCEVKVESANLAAAAAAIMDIVLGQSP